MAPNIEALQGRQLLSFLNPFGAKFARVQSGGVVDVISVAGPGQVFTKRINRNMIAISLAGTTQDSQVTIASLGAGLAGANRPLQIERIVVRSGRLGSFLGPTTADLDGPMTPLTGPVASLQFDAIGPAAQITVNGNLGSLSVGRNLQTSAGGQLHVSGSLGTLSVAGDIQGKGTNDIVIGDDLGQLTVLGGATGGSLQNVSIDVAKNIQGLDIRNGIFNSLIEAGILINGGTPGAGSNGWNIGPDGRVAVMDSEILAGFAIDNLTIGGDVQSDLPSNSAGSPTRIVAGEYPEGTYLPGGTIDKFQITGRLIDSVLAASVEPYNGFYPQPNGTIQVGFTPTPPAPPTTISNYTALPFKDSNVPADLVLAGGSINPSFTPAPLSPITTPGTAVPIPATSTVLGGVVTSPHFNDADFAGIFAADTRGVIVGPLPPVLPPNG